MSQTEGPASRGRGLDGPACPIREHLDQRTPVGMRPQGALCTRCGRMTARRDENGLPWCGGSLPETTEGGKL